MEQRSPGGLGLPEKEWDLAQARGAAPGPASKKGRQVLGEQRGSHIPTLGLAGRGPCLSHVFSVSTHPPPTP